MLRLMCLATCLCAFLNGAEATVISLNFTGNISIIAGNVPASGFSLGDAVTGNVQFDSPGSLVFANPNHVHFQSAPGTISFDVVGVNGVVHFQGMGALMTDGLTLTQPRSTFSQPEVHLCRCRWRTN
jgi:hypothetical protein